ncbi:MAG TPA: PAS domain-containing protein [Microcoleaceae cyanobacterium]|jgi:PAS domain S-box-containing protein
MASLKPSLSESIAWLDQLFAAAIDPIYIFDRTGHYQYANPAGGAALGLQVVDILGKTWRDLNLPAEMNLPVETMERYDAQRELVFQSGIAVTGEISYTTVDGNRDYEYMLSPIGGKAGEITAVINTNRDITERKQTEAALGLLNQALTAQLMAKTEEIKDLEQSLRVEIAERQQAEQALQESQIQFYALADVMFEGVIIQEDGRIINANPGFAKMFGYSLANVMGKPVADFLTDESLATALQHIESQYELPYEITGLKQDGSRINLEVIGKQSVYQGRTVRVSALRDITDRKQAEVVLRDRQSQIQRQLAEIETIYQSAPIGLNVLDPELRFVRINQRLAEMNGLPIEAHLGHTIREVLPELADTAEQLLRPILETGEPLLNVEITGATPAQPGVERTWVESFLPLKEGNQVIGISTICEEITERKRAEAILQERESLLRLFAQYAPAGIAMFDLEMRYVITSQRWAEDYHLRSVDFLIGKSHYEIFPEVPDRWREIHQRCLAGAIEKCDEDLFVRADGTQQWIRWEVRPWYTATGEIGGVIVFSEDITQRKQAEAAILQLNQALQQRVTELQTLLDVIPIGIGIADDPACCQIRVNPAFAQVLNIPTTANASLSAPEPERPSNFKVYQNGQEMAAEELPLQYAATHGIEIRDVEVEVVWQNGTAVTLLEYAAPLLDEHGRPRGSVGAFLDITERKRAEAALRESEARYRTLVQNFPNGAVLLFDRELRYLLAEGQGLAEVGFDRTALEGKTIWEALPSGICQVLESYYRAALAGHAHVIEIPFADRVYRLNCLPVYDDQGEVKLGMAMSQDITVQKQAEQALRTSRDQLERQVQARTRELQQLADELQRSNQELEQFAYVASHDLQEPLRAVTSFTQMLAKRYQGQLDAKADTYIEFIVDGATRMQQLIKDLLAYSRAGRYELKLQPVDCNALTERVQKDLQVAIAETEAVITVAPLPTVTADPNQLSHLFLNLISNSLKYRSEVSPQIHISAEKRLLRLRTDSPSPGGNMSASENQVAWVFSIRDNGIGIEPRYAERIFGIFQRLHTSDEYAGTGLGLAICRKIIERHQGQIWVESQLGQGATFLFTIPIVTRTESDAPR